MNIQLRPASELAKVYGVKSLIYGAPGTGKTPLIQTAPNPVLCVVEPGMLSMRESSLPCWEADTPEKIDQFFQWLFESKASKQFDTVGIDSISQLAEIILTQELNRNKDGRKAYGELSRRVMTYVNNLYYLKEKHIYLIAKEATIQENETVVKKPYFPGQDLNIKIPHLYDEIWHIAETNVPGQPKPVTAIRTKKTFTVAARDRSGKLDALEPPHIGNIFNKCLS